ncbi:MAG: hypothetical protein ACNA7E_02820, partial [Wenzhouxiangellaceae bacterium]
AMTRDSEFGLRNCVSISAISAAYHSRWEIPILDKPEISWFKTCACGLARAPDIQIRHCSAFRPGTSGRRRIQK